MHACMMLVQFPVKKDAYAIDLVRLLLPHVYITHVFTVYVKQI
jgi:hypothetical protein